MQSNFQTFKPSILCESRIKMKSKVDSKHFSNILTAYLMAVCISTEGVVRARWMKVVQHPGTGLTWTIEVGVVAETVIKNINK